MKRLPDYSQNFIRNPRLVYDLLKLTTISDQDIVYDIGAGSGVISSVLAGVCKSVVAIEYEPKTAVKLRENMASYSNVKVVEGDFMSVNLPKRHYKIFANIPFHLSSPIIHKITEAINPPDCTYLIVQKQFGEKMIVDSKRFKGQLGMVIGPEFAVKIKKRLNRTDFWPHPNVDTVLIEIERRKLPLIEKEKMPRYKRFIVGCFSDPRIFAKMPKQQIGLKADIKPSQMTLSQWIELFLISQKIRF